MFRDNKGYVCYGAVLQAALRNEFGPKAYENADKLSKKIIKQKEGVALAEVIYKYQKVENQTLSMIANKINHFWFFRLFIEYLETQGDSESQEQERRRKGYRKDSKPTDDDLIRENGLPNLEIVRKNPLKLKFKPNHIQKFSKKITQTPLQGLSGFNFG